MLQVLFYFGMRYKMIVEKGGIIYCTTRHDDECRTVDCLQENSGDIRPHNVQHAVHVYNPSYRMVCLKWNLPTLYEPASVCIAALRPMTPSALQFCPTTPHVGQTLALWRLTMYIYVVPHS